MRIRLQYVNKFPVSDVKRKYLHDMVLRQMGSRIFSCINVLLERNLTHCRVLEYDYLLQFPPANVFRQEA